MLNLSYLLNAIGSVIANVNSWRIEKLLIINNKY